MKRELTDEILYKTADKAKLSPSDIKRDDFMQAITFMEQMDAFVSSEEDIVDGKMILREDVCMESGLEKELMEAAPQSNGQMIKVPKSI